MLILRLRTLGSPSAKSDGAVKLRTFSIGKISQNVTYVLAKISRSLAGNDTNFIAASI